MGRGYYRGGWQPSCPPLIRRAFSHSAKGFAVRSHSESPRHAFAHCEGFAPAAPRRAWTHVSESISGLLLSQPVRIIGLLGNYPNNNLIRRSLILGRNLRRRPVWERGPSSTPLLSGIIPSFPGLSPSPGQIDYVLLSSAAGAEHPCLAWLSRTPIAVVSGGINRNQDWRGSLLAGEPPLSLSRALSGMNSSFMPSYLSEHDRPFHPSPKNRGPSGPRRAPQASNAYAGHIPNPLRIRAFWQRYIR